MHGKHQGVLLFFNEINFNRFFFKAVFPTFTQKIYGPCMNA